MTLEFEQGNQEDKKNHILISEIVTSSGPRKTHSSNSNINQELGEDAGGTLSLGNNLSVIWVADGASDTNRIGPFSSRILAQDLGQAISELIIIQWSKHRKSKNINLNLDKIICEAVNKTYNLWQSRIKENPQEEQKLALSLSSVQQKATEPGAIFFEFSSTLSTVYIDKQGHLECGSSGDSLIAIFKNEENQFFAFKKGGITFRIKGKGKHIYCEKFLTPIQIYQANETNFAVLSSDGAKDTILSLKENIGLLNPNLKNFLSLKQKSIGVYPRTQDDKTLGILGRIHAS